MALSKQGKLKHKKLQEIRVILIGKTGAGKSYLGNALLGREEFESSVIATSVTDSCAFGIQEITSKSRKYILKVIDTPGVKDNRLPEAEICGELVKCISLTLPGPHYFVIVIQIGRFTGEELDAVNLLKREFGNNLMNFALVVFTHGSKLKGKTIEDYLDAAPPTLQQVIKECNNRYAVIYDDDKNLQESVQNIIDLMVNSAKLEDYYTNDMFNQANENKKIIIKVIEEERNRGIQALQEELEELKRKGADVSWSIEKKMEIHKDKQRKEEELEKTKTTSPEEIYDNKVISDNSVARATFGGTLLAAAATVIVVASGGTVLAVGGTVFAASGAAEIGAATVVVGSMIWTGVLALTGTICGLSTFYNKTSGKPITKPPNTRPDTDHDHNQIS